MPADRKYDLKKDRADYRARSGRFDVFTVPPTRYLMVDGHGDPNTDPSYAAALAALYPVAYALKFASKAEDAPARLGDVRVDDLDEGLCVQTLHIGPYDGEGPVLERMHNEVIPSRGLEMTGTRHEIYLGDPRRAAPEKLRTILPQPVRPGHCT